MAEKFDSRTAAEARAQAREEVKAKNRERAFRVEFLTIVQVVLDLGETFRWEQDTKGMAINLKQQFHRWRAGRLQAVPPDSEAELLKNIMVTLEGNTVVFMPRMTTKSRTSFLEQSKKFGLGDVPITRTTPEIPPEMMTAEQIKQVEQSGQVDRLALLAASKQSVKERHEALGSLLRVADGPRTGVEKPMPEGWEEWKKLSRRQQEILEKCELVVNNKTALGITLGDKGAAQDYWRAVDELLNGEEDALKVPRDMVAYRVNGNRIEFEPNYQDPGVHDMKLKEWKELGQVTEKYLWAKAMALNNLPPASTP